MFYYLEGIVAHMEPFIAVIDCGGVGYLCHVTTMTQARIKQGQKARLYTHLNVRETPWRSMVLRILRSAIAF